MFNVRCSLPREVKLLRVPLEFGLGNSHFQIRSTRHPARRKAWILRAKVFATGHDAICHGQPVWGRKKFVPVLKKLAKIKS
jgi:hypothetical protein